MIYVLASTHSRHEFNVAYAINAAGALAVVPREWVHEPAVPEKNKPERTYYRPLLPRLMFLACTEAQWHQFHDKRLIGPQGILPPIRRELDILPRTWASFQDFAARAETECEYRIGMHERGRKVRNMRPGDVVRLVKGAIGDIDLRDKIVKITGIKGDEITVETDVQIMGKPVMARVRPDDVQGVAI